MILSHAIGLKHRNQLLWCRFTIRENTTIEKHIQDRHPQMKPFSLSVLLLLIHMPAHADLINKREYNVFLLGRVAGATELARREKVGIDKAKC